MGWKLKPASTTLLTSMNVLSVILDPSSDPRSGASLDLQHERGDFGISAQGEDGAAGRENVPVKGRENEQRKRKHAGC